MTTYDQEGNGAYQILIFLELILIDFFNDLIKKGFNLSTHLTPYMNSPKQINHHTAMHWSIRSASFHLQIQFFNVKVHEKQFAVVEWIHFETKPSESQAD